MRVLVTGAGGFIGRALVAAARTQGLSVVGVARRACVEADVVADLRADLSGLPRADVVVHLAGGYAGARANELNQIDVRIARNLIDWGRRQRINRWVVASAAEVYGCVNGVAEETHELRPVIPYGVTKLCVETMFLDAGIPHVTILRIGEVYGPGGRLLSELIGRLRAGFCPWPGSGEVPLSFIHVNDAAQALLQACARSGVPRVFNVGDEEPSTWRNFLELLAGLLRTRGPVYLPVRVARAYALCAVTVDSILRRPAVVTPHVVRLLTTPKIISITRARRELDFEPHYGSIRDGLAEAVDAL